MKLRKLQKTDAEGMLEWMHDSDINKNFRANMSKKTISDVLMFIKKASVTPEEGKDVHFAIASEANEYLGTISLKNFDMEAKNAEYAICIRKCGQGKGIATWATRELLRIAFDEYGLERVYLNVLSDNRRAIHLYEKCGFIYEGEFQKHLLLNGEYKSLKWYGILRDDYESREAQNGNKAE